MNITIRQVTEKDTIALLPLTEQLGYNISETDLLKNIQLHLTPDYNLFVAETQGKLIGFISIHVYRYPHLTDSLSRITALCVDADHRSFGIGRQLLHYAEEYIKEQGCKIIELTSGLQREDAHRFRVRAGYALKRLITISVLRATPRPETANLTNYSLKCSIIIRNKMFNNIQFIIRSTTMLIISKIVD